MGIIGWTIKLGVILLEIFRIGRVILEMKRKKTRLLPSLKNRFKINFKTSINIKIAKM